MNPHPSGTVPEPIAISKATQDEARVLSVQFREGLACYDLKPREFALAHLMCLETFDRDLSEGRVQLAAWSRKLGLVEGKGVREDKCNALLGVLHDLGICAVNQAQGTFELRPDARVWSRARALRGAAPPTQEAELGLNTERLLPEALSAVSRENALERGRLMGLPDLVAQMRAAANFADDVRRKKPPTSAEKAAETQVPENQGGAEFRQNPPTPAIALASLALRSKLSLAKAELPQEGSAAFSAEEAMRWLESVDRAGALRSEWTQRQWSGLCQRDPAYVLRRLKWALEDAESQLQKKERSQPIGNPLAWLSRKARDEHKLPELVGGGRRDA